MSNRIFDSRNVSRACLLVISMLVMFFPTGLIYGSTYSSFLIEPCVTATSPPVILQIGTAGSSTIYTNATSAKVSFSAPRNSSQDYVDNNTSNVDSSADKGTHSNFPSQQNLDSSYDTLTEYGFLNTTAQPRYAVTGSTSAITGAPNQVYAAIGKGATCDVSDYQGGNRTIKKVYLNITYYGTVSGTLAWAYRLDAGAWNNIENLPEGGSASSPLTRTYNATGLRATWTWSNLNTTDIQFQNNDAGGPEDAYVDAMYVTVVTEATYYELDLEVQWTTADYDETNEVLAIYAGRVNTNSLNATGGYMIIGDGTPDWGSTTGTISFWVKMDTSVQGRFWGQSDNMETRWSGTNLIIDWGAAGTMTSAYSFSANKWYFVAIVWDENNNNLFLYVGDKNSLPALDSNSMSGTWTGATPATTQNRFMNSGGGNEPVDGRGDDLRYWDIARSLAQIQGDYNTELTGSESNLRSYFRLNGNFDDIGPNNNDGSGSGSYSFSSDLPFPENIRVDVWSGSTWQNLLTSLTNGWNNVSVNSYLTSQNLTIRFKGSVETSDLGQDRWYIDATLLHIYTFLPQQTYDHVLKVNNTVTDSWQIRLRKYSDSGTSRLQNCTIYFHNSSDGTSGQIYVENGVFTQSIGPWYSLPSSTTIYVAMTVSANSTGTSNLYAYLDILVPNKTTYAQYVLTFQIT